MNKTVLVTGGNKGIGLEVTRKFLAMNYTVIVVARSFEGCDLPESDNLVKKSFDLTDVEKIPELIAELGAIDILINNAGVMHSLPFDQYPAVIPEARKAAIKKIVFTGRFAKPEEVAKAIVWLATESPAYINGTCTDINDGAYVR
jgi:NAD(P)-dependent dehydrogenase (short-subunit alcohol dehydrogenase family)